MKYKFSKNVIKKQYNNKIILLHSKTGKWIRMSTSIYEIIFHGIINNYDISEIIKSLCDVSDKEFIREIYNKLIDLEILINENENDRAYLSVIFELTRRCNLKCLHCCINANDSLTEDLSFDEIKTIITNIVNSNPAHITLTGGEPLIRDDFFDILEFLRSVYGGKVSVMTNGTLINSNNVERLIKYVDQIDISLDGVDEHTCSIVRGKGVFDKVLENIKLLKSFNFNNISLSITIGDKNINLEYEFLQLNKRLETYPIIRSFVPIGRGKKNSKLFYNNKLNENLEDNFKKELIELEHTKKFTPCTCGAGKEKLCIDYLGDIYPCQWFFENCFKLGNALINQICELSNDNILKELEKFYPNNFSKCKDCIVNVFCWPCPGELMFCAENMEEFNTLCQRKKAIFIKNVWGE